MTTTKQTRCQWCYRTMDDDPGAYYHKKACKAKFWRKVREEMVAWEERYTKQWGEPPPIESFRGFLKSQIDDGDFVGD